MINLKDMLKAGIHFGHKTSKWSPAMNPYIWGSRNKIHLIDVSKTAFLLERAGNYLKNLASEGKSFLWIGTKKPAQGPIKKTASSLKMPFVVHRWIGGTLSNYDQIKKAMTKLLHLKDAISKSTSYYKKKEISMMQKESARLEKNIGGILDLDYPPSAVIIVDAKKELSAAKEALKLKIPTIAIVDTNTNPEDINFIIPANDDSQRSITFVLEYLASCAEEGKKLFEAKKATIAKEKEEKKAATQATAKKATTKDEHQKVDDTKIVEKKTTAAKAVVKKTNEKTVAKPEKTTKTVEKTVEAKSTKTAKPVAKTTKTEKTTESKKAVASKTETKKAKK